MPKPLPASHGSGRRFSAVLFDFAGTLLTPRPADQLLVGAARRAGVELSPAELEELTEAYRAAGVPGAPYPQRVPEHLVELYERRDLTAENHRGAYVGLFEAIEYPRPGLRERLSQAMYGEILGPDGWMPYADAVETVDAVAARGLRVGLVSNVGFDIREILRRHGLGRLAETCTLSFEVGHVKPDPQIFRIAAERLGAPAEGTLMVGDHERADGGAEAAGMGTLILPMTEPGSVHGLDRVLRRLDGGPEHSG